LDWRASVGPEKAEAWIERVEDLDRARRDLDRGARDSFGMGLTPPLSRNVLERKP